LRTTVGTPLTVGRGGTGRVDLDGGAAGPVGLAGAVVVRRALVDGFAVVLGAAGRDEVDGAALVVGVVDAAEG
jgi:hypothetical protein